MPVYLMVIGLTILLHLLKSLGHLANDLHHIGPGHVSYKSALGLGLGGIKVDVLEVYPLGLRATACGYK